MKKIFSIIFVVACIANCFAQQEPHYTQNQFNSNLLLNPAYAGTADCPSLGLRYRNQWTGFDGAPVTVSFIGETKVADKLGAGLTLNHDRIGIDKALTLDGNLSYHLPVSEKGRMAFGAKVGASFLRSDFGGLTGVNPADPLYLSSGKATIPFIGLGLLYFNDKAYAGLSVPRLVAFENPKAGTEVSQRHYYLYGGYRFVLDEDFDLRPAIMARYQPAAPLQFDLASDLWFKNKIGFGLSYRTGDAVDFMVKGRIQNVYLGYSYDMTVSQLRTMNNGTHEFMIGYEFCRQKNQFDPRMENIRHF